MSGDMVRAEPLAIRSFGDLEHVAGMFVASGFFKDSKDLAQAAVKIAAGVELGFGPMASMTGIHVVQGKPEVGAALQAALVKRSARYDYRVRALTNEACSVEFLERQRDGSLDGLGVSSFTIEDAKKAGLMTNPTWQKYPRNMLLARCITNGVAWYCPDVLGGVRCYDVGEVDPAPETAGMHPGFVEATLEAKRVVAGSSPPACVAEAVSESEVKAALNREIAAASLPAKAVPSDDALRAAQDAARAKAQAAPAPSLAESLARLGLAADSPAGVEILGPLDGKALAESYLPVGKAVAQKLGRERATALVNLVGAGKSATLAQVRDLVLAAGAEVRS